MYSHKIQAKMSYLTEQLITVKEELIESPNKFNDWHSMWWGLVGVIYSLTRALPLSPENNRSRNPKKIVDDAEEILKSSLKGIDLQMNKCNSWVVGYYINDAEFRIALTFHKLLKACYDCSCNFNGPGENNSGIEGLYVSKLVEKLLDSNNSKCNKCHAKRITLSRRIRKVLRDFDDCDSYLNNKKPSYTPKRNVGCQLAKLHHQVNDLKHTHMPQIDKQSPKIRMKNTITCLSEICSMFIYIASQRGKLRN